MIALVISLVLTGIASGPIFARVQATSLRRLLGWALLTGTLIAADMLLRGAAPMWRMVGICCVLLGAMKGLVYAEWARGHGLPLTRYLIFAFAWFGMDPGSFQVRRQGQSWRADIAIGAGLMLIGALGEWLVWAMEWRQIFVMFLPMSLGFHFGALRVLKGGLRAAGFPVRTLFPNVMKARGIGDFWAMRWNTGYSQMMQRIVGRPAGKHLGESMGIMAVFVTSGLLHEAAITLPVHAGFGLPTLYFTFHGILTVCEHKWNRPIGKLPALLAVIVPLGWLFPPIFQAEVIAKFLNIFRFL